jgi:hypothetical protein
MSLKQKLFLILNFILTFTLVGFILIKPYIVDKVLDIGGKDLGFVGLYDNPLIYVIIFLGFINSFILISYVVIIYYKQAIKSNSKWIKLVILSIFLFLTVFIAHNQLVRYSILAPTYKKELQEKLGVWSQNTNKKNS